MVLKSNSQKEAGTQLKFYTSTRFLFVISIIAAPSFKEHLKIINNLNQGRKEHKRPDSSRCKAKGYGYGHRNKKLCLYARLKKHR